MDRIERIDKFIEFFEERLDRLTIFKTLFMVASAGLGGLAAEFAVELVGDPAMAIGILAGACVGATILIWERISNK